MDKPSLVALACKIVSPIRMTTRNTAMPLDTPRGLLLNVPIVRSQPTPHIGTTVRKPSTAVRPAPTTVTLP